LSHLEILGPSQHCFDYQSDILVSSPAVESAKPAGDDFTRSLDPLTKFNTSQCSPFAHTEKSLHVDDITSSRTDIILATQITPTQAHRSALLSQVKDDTPSQISETQPNLTPILTKKTPSSLSYNLVVNHIPTPDNCISVISDKIPEPLTKDISIASKNASTFQRLLQKSITLSPSHTTSTMKNTNFEVLATSTPRILDKQLRAQRVEGSPLVLEKHKVHTSSKKSFLKQDSHLTLNEDMQLVSSPNETTVIERVERRQGHTNDVAELHEIVEDAFSEGSSISQESTTFMSLRSSQSDEQERPTQPLSNVKTSRDRFLTTPKNVNSPCIQAEQQMLVDASVGKLVEKQITESTLLPKKDNALENFETPRSISLPVPSPSCTPSVKNKSAIEITPRAKVCTAEGDETQDSTLNIKLAYACSQNSHQSPLLQDICNNNVTNHDPNIMHQNLPAEVNLHVPEPKDKDLENKYLTEKCPLTNSQMEDGFAQKLRKKGYGPVKLCMYIFVFYLGY
jgi:hypothetical protein